MVEVCSPHVRMRYLVYGNVVTYFIAFLLLVLNISEASNFHKGAGLDQYTKYTQIYTTNIRITI